MAGEIQRNQFVDEKVAKVVNEDFPALKEEVAILRHQYQDILDFLEKKSKK